MSPHVTQLFLSQVGRPIKDHITAISVNPYSIASSPMQCSVCEPSSSLHYLCQVNCNTKPAYATRCVHACRRPFGIGCNSRTCRRGTMRWGGAAAGGFAVEEEYPDENAAAWHNPSPTAPSADGCRASPCAGSLLAADGQQVRAFLRFVVTHTSIAGMHSLTCSSL